MRKLCVLLVIITFFAYFEVYAAPVVIDPNTNESIFGEGEGGGSNVTTDMISINYGDYELTCVYSDGAELTITKEEIYIATSSISMNANSNSKISFYLTENQRPVRDANGKITTSRASSLLSGFGACPNRLYLYKVRATVDTNEDQETALEDVYNYYYSNLSGIEETISGTSTTGMLWWEETESNAREQPNIIRLVSEEVNLTTSKKAQICDYQTIGQSVLGSQTASLYIFSNISLLEVGNRITTLPSRYGDCPAMLTEEEMIQNNPNKKYLVINDPTPRIVGNVLSGNYEYNSIRFIAINGNKNSEACTKENGGNPCTVYQYIGKRNGAPDNNSANDVCKVLGNDTINILKTIVSWLQILVPALVIVLIGIDITKMVLSGNIEEELPKKKKTMIIRLIVMTIFFFAPIIAGLIINLLNEMGIINVGDLTCFFK